MLSAVPAYNSGSFSTFLVSDLFSDSIGYFSDNSFTVALYPKESPIVP